MDWFAEKKFKPIKLACTLRAMKPSMGPCSFGEYDGHTQATDAGSDDQRFFVLAWQVAHLQLS